MIIINKYMRTNRNWQCSVKIDEYVIKISIIKEKLN